MFENLTNKLEGILSRLKKAPSLNETQVEAGLQEIREALLAADVSLPIVHTPDGGDFLGPMCFSLQLKKPVEGLRSGPMSTTGGPRMMVPEGCSLRSAWVSVRVGNGSIFIRMAD